jgi:Regulator of chromosome condensation (RCC1) repeat/Carboxypeptidase regulatory-like domain
VWWHMGRLSREAFEGGESRMWAASALYMLAVLLVIALSLSEGVPAASAASYGPVAWGDNNYGQLGDGDYEGFSIAPVAVGRLGEEVTVGDEVAVGEEVTALAAGYEHGLALLRNGKVMAWGENGDGQLGDGTSLGPETCVFLSDCSKVPVEVKELDEATAIAAGYYFSLALLSSGKVMAWGDGGNGQLGDGNEFKSEVPAQVTGLSEAAAIAGGGFHSLALLKNGTVMAWGEDEYGQLGNGNETNSNVPVEVIGLSGVKAVAVGVQHSLALLSSGKIMAWGENGSGQLGDGSRTSSDVPVEASELSGVTAIAAGGYSSLAKQGEIGELTGKVTSAATSGPIEGVKVCVMNVSGPDRWRCATTDADGEYTVTVHESGSYDVRFLAPPGSGYVASEYYNGKFSSSEASAVAITLGAITSGIDAQLAEGGRIIGTVTNASTKAPVEAVEVCARESGSECAMTNAKGEYAISGLATGEYEVEFYPISGMYLPQYWDGKRLVSEGQLVPVTVSQTTSGINAELGPSTNGAITGTVRDNTTIKGIKGIEVCAYEIGGKETEGLFGQCTETNIRGEYAILAIATGEYLVEFSSPFSSNLNYVTQYFKESSSVADATPVPVRTKGVATGIDAQLREGGRIAGKVTDGSTTAAIKGIEVCAFSTSTESFGCASTDSKGEYAISALANGEYDVEFLSPPNGKLDYLTQYYDGEHKLSMANPVPVRAGSTAQNIDARLKQGGRIEGKVTDASTNTAIKGVLVCALVSISESVGCGVTGAGGEYAISGLPGSQYKVGFDAGKRYFVQYYKDKPSFSEAQPVTVTVGSTRSGIDAATQSRDSIPPVNTKPPVVSGTPALGETLLCASGLWTGSPTPTLTDRWLREGVPIVGATASSYTVQGTDEAHSLTCEVMARSSAGEKSAVSAPVAIPGSPTAPTTTTSSANPTTTGTLEPDLTSSGPHVTITASMIVVSGTSARVHVQCGDEACRGSVELVVQEVVRHRKGKKTGSLTATLVLAKGSFSLTDKGASVVLSLTIAGKKRLAHAKRHPIAAELILSVQGSKTIIKSVMAS